MGLWSCDATSFFVSWVHDCAGDGLHEFFPCPYPYLNASNSVYMKILSVILRRNLFPENLTKKYISKYIQTAVNGGKTQLRSGVEFQEPPKFYFKIPYVEHFLVTAQRSIRKLANQLCNPIDRRLVFTTFEIKNIFGVDDSSPERLRTHVVYKFLCASFNTCYFGETSRHFSTQVREHPFPTGLRTFLHICRIQSFVEHPAIGLLRDPGLCSN